MNTHKNIIINGFGRIGRLFTRLYDQDQQKNFNLVGFNDLQSHKTAQHLMEFDSIYGRYHLDWKNYEYTSGTDLADLLKKYPGALVIEATGAHQTEEKMQKFLSEGASQVLLTAPGKGSNIKTVCFGLNHQEIKSDHKLISAASCTTGALAPIVDFAQKNLSVQSFFFTTIHAATNDQRIQDTGHKDLRRARSVFNNLIPTATGASKALKNIFPNCSFPLEGTAIRSPHAAVSLLDITIHCEKNTLPQSKEEILSKLKKACQKNYQGLMRVEDKELVSSDFIQEAFSVVLDQSTLIVQKDTLKILAWYDNEYGYTKRLYELAQYLLKNEDDL